MVRVDVLRFHDSVLYSVENSAFRAMVVERVGTPKTSTMAQLLWVGSVWVTWEAKCGRCSTRRTTYKSSAQLRSLAWSMPSLCWQLSECTYQAASGMETTHLPASSVVT